jgi:hypothetical protein
MIRTNIVAAAAAALIGAGVLASTTLPAAADSAYFGLQVGGRGDPAVSFGFSSGYPAYRGYPRYAPYDEYRPVYRRAARPVEVCRPVWQTRRLRDDWGRVYKVVKVRAEECRLVYR